LSPEEQSNEKKKGEIEWEKGVGTDRNGDTQEVMVFG